MPIGPGAFTKIDAITWTWIATTDPESSVVDYQIEIGTTPNGNDIAKEVSLGTAQTYTRALLTTGITYYARVRAINGAALASAYSPSSAGTTIDTTDPRIIGPQITSHTSSTVTFTWTTSELTTRQIRYGTTSQTYPAATLRDADYTTHHALTINDLASQTTYYFQILADDQAGNSAVSSELTLTTSSGPGSSSTSPAAEPSPILENSSPSATPSLVATITPSLTLPQTLGSAAVTPSMTALPAGTVKFAGTRSISLGAPLIFGSLLGIALIFLGLRRKIRAR